MGHNPALEALTAGLSLKQAYVAEGTERDDRLRDVLRFAAEHSLPLLQMTRAELDRVTGGFVHRGVALQLPAFDYTDIRDIFDMAFEVPSWGLVVALDRVASPRNLGAIIRSVAAFGAQGVVIPARRSASVTVTTWKTSTGATARIPAARVANPNQMLRRTSGAGFAIIGLVGEGDTPPSGIPGLDSPVMMVIDFGGEGLARLVRGNYDALVSTPITSAVESLDASVTVSIAPYEIGQRQVS